jgi:hypothetical protein
MTWWFFDCQRTLFAMCWHIIPLSMSWHSTLRYWIRYGAEHEDDGFGLNFWTPALTLPRFLNHFHAPTRTLDRAGLDDTIMNTILGGISTVIWSQDAVDQNTVTGGDWSWNTVRDYWYKNLTALTDQDTDDNLAKLLTGLGYGFVHTWVPVRLPV